MSENNRFHANHELPRFTWDESVLKNARKYRMRLAWSVWFVTALFVLFQFFLQLSSGEMIKGLMHSFALTALGGGVLASSYYYIYVLLQTPAGMLLDRYGPRGILSLGAFTVSIGCVLMAISKTLLFALIGRILMGAGSAFAFVGCMDVISIWFPAKRFALMASIVETAGMLGAIIGNFWLAKVIEHAGWRDCIFIAAFFAVILALLLWIIVRNAPTKKSIASKKDCRTLFSGLKEVIANGQVWLNGIYSGVMFSVVTVFTALWAIPFFELTHDMNLVQATMIASALYVGVATGGPLLGWLDSRTSWRRSMLIVNAFASAVLLSFIIFKLTLSLIVIALLLFFTGMCASSYVLTFAIANEIASAENSATCIGFTNMLCVIFAPILQPFIGFLVSRSHGNAIVHFQWALSIIPIALLIAAMIAFFLPKK